MKKAFHGDGFLCKIHIYTFFNATYVIAPLKVILPPEGWWVHASLIAL